MTRPVELTDYSQPYRNILLTCSSNPGPDAEGPQRLASSLTSSEHTITPSTSVCLFPSFLFIPSINEDQSGATALVSTLGDPQQEPAKMGLTAHALGGRNIDHITILICSHGTRDSRCGILGPILQSEFMKQMKRAGIRVFETFESVGSDKSPSENGATVNLISHVGGHRWAGNVIIYIPPSWKHHPLAGTGIWYGRVAPSHVEGIVNSTVVRGDIISELFRGGLHANRSPMRLPDELK